MVSGRVRLLFGTVIFSGVTIIFGPPANIRYRLTVLIHNSGHFGPPLPFWAPGPPALPGLPMASYATGHFYQLVVDSWLRLRSAIRFQGRWKYATHKRVEMFFSVIENVAHTRSPLPFFSRRSFYSGLSLSYTHTHTHLGAITNLASVDLPCNNVDLLLRSSWFNSALPTENIACMMQHVFSIKWP